MKKITITVLTALVLMATPAIVVANSGGVSPGGGDFKGPWKKGEASFYGKGTFVGYCGDRFTSEKAFVFAHKSLPCGKKVQFKGQNGKIAIGRVVDRGPFTEGRDFDLSFALAKRLGLIKKGVGTVSYRH